MTSSMTSLFATDTLAACFNR